MSEFVTTSESRTVTAHGIFNKIKSEREFSRSHNRGELGVRVQSSKISSPTEDEAIANVMLDEAMKTGEITDGLLKGIDDAKTYAKEIRIISIMKMDYELLEEFVEDLDDLDCQMMKAFLIKKMYIKEIAAETGMSYDYTKRRLKTLREEITLEVVDCIEMNCGGGYVRCQRREKNLRLKHWRG
ncbi:MAG: hypothetical protein KIH00_03115, partial [Lachnospiraceae bacterium]|nr:hypothetical protein [Lachnospiraceae bacterium]